MNKRLFVGIDLPEEICDQLKPLCCGLPGARWVPLEQLHLTLCFIGETDGSTFLDIKEALSEIVAAPFSLQLRGVGAFPPRGQPRIVWVGVEKCEPLMVLQRKITTRLFQLGLSLENRKYSPHLTLARLHQTPPARVGKFFIEHSLFALPPFAVDRFILYSSVLGRKGSIYSMEQAYRLMAADA
ncbi:MAG: RNA 2',3'-cyclic phosphodiesterase [Desulfobulbus oligotrophicus]|jgi:2'-5' RNA ligase|nr:RNA 2',3'-cyclic phosphodiesterase [Desulfobulbus oligotrophicus]